MAFPGRCRPTRPNPWQTNAFRPPALEGRFIAEFGGKGNIRSILAALDVVFGAAAEERCPWWFPGIGEYASLLERHGFEVRQASLFDRPTPIEGERGMEDWIEKI